MPQRDIPYGSKSRLPASKRIKGSPGLYSEDWLTEDPDLMISDPSGDEDPPDVSKSAHGWSASINRHRKGPEEAMSDGAGPHQCHHCGAEFDDDPDDGSGECSNCTSASVFPKAECLQIRSCRKLQRAYEALIERTQKQLKQARASLKEQTFSAQRIADWLDDRIAVMTEGWKGAALGGLAGMALGRASGSSTGALIGGAAGASLGHKYEKGLKKTPAAAPSDENESMSEGWRNTALGGLSGAGIGALASGGNPIAAAVGGAAGAYAAHKAEQDDEEESMSESWRGAVTGGLMGAGVGAVTGGGLGGHGGDEDPEEGDD
jgi:outer membrane lipoprotein SlyB